MSIFHMTLLHYQRVPSGILRGAPGHQWQGLPAAPRRVHGEGIWPRGREPREEPQRAGLRREDPMKMICEKSHPASAK